MMRRHIVAENELLFFILIMIGVLVTLYRCFDVHEFHKLEERAILKVKLSFNESDIGRSFFFDKLGYHNGWSLRYDLFNVGEVFVN